MKKSDAVSDADSTDCTLYSITQLHTVQCTVHSMFHLRPDDCLLSCLLPEKRGCKGRKMLNDVTNCWYRNVWWQIKLLFLVIVVENSWNFLWQLNNLLTLSKLWYSCTVIFVVHVFPMSAGRSSAMSRHEGRKVPASSNRLLIFVMLANMLVKWV